MPQEYQGPTGWLGNVDAEYERSKDTPGVAAFGFGAAGNQPLPGIEQYVREYMDKQYGTGTGWDFTCAERRLYGDVLWTNQPNGNCVGSSMGISMGSRIAHDVFAVGDAENPLGDTIWTPSSGIPFIPFLYGSGRHVGGFTGNGDGSWGTAQLEATHRYGFLDCNEVEGYPPEYPQSNSSTNKLFGRNFTECTKYLEPASQRTLDDSVTVDTFDELWHAMTVDFMPAIAAGDCGFGYDRTERGLRLYKHDRRWSHQMSIRRALEFTQDGRRERYIWVGNQWGKDNHGGDCGFWLDEQQAENYVRRSFVACLGQITTNAEDKAPAIGE